MVESLLRDARYAIRGLLTSRGFTAVAVLSLALGIGINTAIFSLVNAVLLRPLPVKEPDRLVEIYTSAEIPESTTSYPDYLDLVSRSRTLSGIAGHTLMFANISRDGQSRLALGEIVTANYFDVLGVAPSLGRTFDSSEDRTEGGDRVVVISDRMWKRAFGGDTSVVGRTLRVRGRDYTIVGVMPARFTGMTPGLMAELWIPASMVGEVEPVGMNDVVPSPTGKTRFTQRGARWMFVKGRLKPGVTFAEARADVESVMARLAEEYPQTNRNRRCVLKPSSDVRIHPMIDGALLPGAAAMLVGVGLVLLVTCANIANMLLARGTARRREMAIRLAIGAGRGRIVRQLIVESMLLAMTGGTAGLLLASWCVRLVGSVQPPFPIPITLDLGLDVRVLAFTSVISLAAGILFGLAPALQATRPDLVPSLKNDPASSRERGRFAFRNLLVVAQVTVSVVLLIGAALLTRGALAAAAIDVGFSARGLAISTVDLQMHRYTPDRGHAFYRDAIERVRALPGVTSAALAERLPFSPNIHTSNMFIEGRSYQSESMGDLIDVTRVSAGYFETLGVPLLAGRDFDPRDTETSPGAAIINEAMARKYWPGLDPIGRRMHLLRPDGQSYEIIGVVRDHKVRTIGETPRPLIHFARSQGYAPSATILARTSGDASRLVHDMRRVMLGLEPELVFIENQTMESEIATSMFPARAGAALAAAFGGLALLLASIGLYGVMAFWVGRRTREIGVRMALGARSSSVVGLVLAQGMTLVGCGLISGVPLAMLVTRVLAGSLYGVPAVDPIAYSVSVAALVAVALIAQLFPARRAARVDPMTALRTI
jgi:macrolide transport system ATP-binding/permease protein